MHLDYGKKIRKVGGKKLPKLGKTALYVSPSTFWGKAKIKKPGFSTFLLESKYFSLGASKLHSTCPEDLFQEFFLKKECFHEKIYTLGQNFPDFLRDFFASVVKTAFYVSRRTNFLKNTLLWKHLSFFNTRWLRTKIFHTVGKKTRQFCQNCIPRVQKESLREYRVKEKFFLFKFFRTSIEKFS